MCNRYQRFLCLLALAGCWSWPAVAAEAARVALIDFTSDIQTYRSMVGASDFSIALQAMMSSQPDTMWVERNQWQAAAQELKLTAFNNGGLAGALRLGRWVKADLLVVGGFQADQKQGRELKMEVIDLEHADVLAECTVGISSNTNEPIRVSADKLSGSAQALGKALQEAKTRRERVRAQNKIAPLFFGNVGHSSQLDFFEGDLLEAFQKAASSATNVHVLQLPRAREATEEAELIIGGLVEADLEAWQHVADVYVWGSFAERGAANLPFEQVPVDVTWYVWDGRTEPQQFTVTVTVAGLPQLAGKVAKTGIEAAQNRARSGVGDPQIRSRVAELLLTRANERKVLFDQSPSLYATPQGQAWWHYQVNALNAARFFDPQNQRIQKLAVTQRWAPLWVKPGAPWFKSDLWAKEQCAADFAGFVDKFGLAGDGQFDGSLARRYVEIQYGVLAELEREEGGAEWLADWPAEVRMDWHKRLDNDFLQRIQLADHAYLQVSEKARQKSRDIYVEWEAECLSQLWDYTRTTVHDPEVRAKIFEDMWAAAPDRVADAGSVNSIKHTFAEIEQPEKGQRIVDEMLGLLRQRQESQAKVHLPRHPMPETLHIAIPPVNALPPKLTPAMRRIELPEADKPQGVISLCYASGRLWVSTQSIDRNNHSGDTFSTYAGSGLPGQLFPLLVEPTWTRLVSYDPAAKTEVDLTARLGPHSKITSLLGHEDKLWLTLQGNGVWCLDPRTLQVQRFGSREGVVSEELYASALVPPFLFFGGGQPATGQLGALNTRTAQWMEEKAPTSFQQITTLSGCRQYLLVGAQSYEGAPAVIMKRQVLLSNTQQHSWTNLTESLFAGSPWPYRSGWDLIASSADDQGFWLGSTSGLIFVNPDDGTIKKWFPPLGVYVEYPVQHRKRDQPSNKPNDDLRPTTRLCGLVTALAHDGEFLWIATTPGGAGVFNRHGDTSNMFYSDDDNFIFLFHKPSGQWVGQFQVDTLVTSLAVSVAQLWIGLGRAEPGALLEVDKRPLLQIPRANWVSDDVSVEEFDRRIAKLDVTNQARYYFYVGDTKKVLNLLHDQAAKDPGSEAQKLMIMSTEEPAPDESARPQASAVAGEGTASTHPSEKDLADAIGDGDVEKVAALLPAFKDESTLGKALCIAASQGQIKIVQLLLSQGVSVNFQDKPGGKPGSTALIGAAANGRTDIVRELLAHGAKLEMGNDLGNTALHVAASFGNVKTVKLLMEKGAAIEARNDYGWTPLMFAAQCGSVATAKELLSRGAQLNAVNAGGYSALGIAEDHQCTGMIAFLKQMGAKPFRETNMP